MRRSNWVQIEVIFRRLVKFLIEWNPLALSSVDIQCESSWRLVEIMIKKCTFLWRLSTKWSNKGPLGVDLRSVFKTAQDIDESLQNLTNAFFSALETVVVLKQYLCLYWMRYISHDFITLVVPISVGLVVSIIVKSSLYRRIGDVRWFSVTIPTLEASFRHQWLLRSISALLTLMVLYQDQHHIYDSDCSLWALLLMLTWLW